MHNDTFRLLTLYAIRGLQRIEPYLSGLYGLQFRTLVSSNISCLGSLSDSPAQDVRLSRHTFCVIYKSAPYSPRED